jgi:hypothetical protein
MLPSGLADIVADEEDLARFLTSSSLFSADMVKPAAFLPNPRNGETSVFRHGSRPRAPLWQIAEGHMSAGRTLHGAAIVKAKHVRAEALEVVAHEPPPRHANIVNWPSSQADPDMAKAARRERAVVIAQHAELVRR